MLALARLIRCAIVASGTRNALAISAVVSPPTARRVSAMADGAGERGMTAHEEQHERVVAPRRRPRRPAGERLVGRELGSHRILAAAAGHARPAR